MRSKWSADNPDRQKSVLFLMSEGDKSFTDLYKNLHSLAHARRAKGWARQTLNLYLKELVKKGCVKRVQRGKREIYSLVKDHPYVMELLGRVRIGGRINLSQLDECDFIEDWINIMKFGLLNIIQDYLTIGRGYYELKKRGDGSILPIEQFIEDHFSDMSEICQFYGAVFAERISRGELDPQKIWDFRNKLLEEIKTRERQRASIGRDRV